MKGVLVGVVLSLLFLPFLAGAQGCTPDLVSYWSFDDDLNDVCNLFSTTAYGSVSRVDGNMGRAASFNGQDGNYIFAETQSNKITTNLTLMAWFKTADGEGKIVNKLWTHYELSISNSKLTARIVTDHPSGGEVYTVYTVVSNQDVNDNEWHHAALTFETGGKLKLYLDSGLAGETDVQGEIFDYPETVFFGGYNWNPSDPASQCCYLDGDIDEVRMHDRALSPYEIFEYVNSDSASYFNIENPKVRMRIASSGFIESLYDKQNNRELLASRQRFFQYSTVFGNTHYFTNVSMVGNDLHLLDVIEDVNFVLAVSTDDDYIMFTIKSVSVPPNMNLASLDLKLKTNSELLEVYGGGWDFAYKNYVGDHYFTLMSMPLSPNVNSEIESDTTTRSLVTNFRSYPALNSMIGSKMILITLPASAASFEREDILLRIKTKLNMRQSTLSDIYYPTLFVWFSESETDAVRDFAISSGFKNILIPSGGSYGPGWSIDNGYWDVNLVKFPNGINSLKSVVDKLHASGLKVGLHLLPTLLHPNNSLVLSDPQNSILRYPNGTAYHPTGVYAGTWGIFYVVNLKDDNIMNAVASNYANVINQIGVDMVYFDGSEIVGTEAVGPENVGFYTNKYLEILLSKIRNNISVQIVFSVLYGAPMYSKRQTLADGIDYFRDNSIKDWIDQTAIQWIIYYRYRFLNPELGWMWYHVTKDVSEYEYALSSSIALGAPLVLEGDWQYTFVPAFSSPNYAAFRSALERYMSVFNKYAGRTILKESLFYPYKVDDYTFTQYERGLAAFYVDGNTDLPVGKNRDVWVHVKQNMNLVVNLKFTDLLENRKYKLNNSGEYISVLSDSQGNATVTIDLDDSPAYNLLNLYISADLNNDGIVDVEDLSAIALDFGKTSGFNPDADTNSDGEVDIFDVVFVASRFS